MRLEPCYVFDGEIGEALVLLIERYHVAHECSVAKLLDPLVQVFDGASEFHLKHVALALCEAVQIVLNHADLLQKGLIIVEGVVV